MEEKDCWEKFAVSGKVEDYLKYRSSVGYAAHSRADSIQASQVSQAFPVKTDAYGSSQGISARSREACY